MNFASIKKIDLEIWSDFGKRSGEQRHCGKQETVRVITKGVPDAIYFGTARGAGPVGCGVKIRSIETGRLAPLRYKDHPFNAKAGRGLSRMAGGIAFAFEKARYFVLIH